MTQSWDDLLARTAPEVRERGMRLARKYKAEILLEQLRESHGLSRAEMADLLGDVGGDGDEADLRVSQLEALVTRLGGELAVTATFPGGRIEMKHFGKGERREIAAVG